MGALAVWGSGLGLAILLTLAVEVGYRAQGRTARRAGRPPEGDGRDWTMIVSAALTLLAFLLSFTVSMAVDGYEHRRQVVSDEANAISTTYLRAQLFGPPASDRLAALTARYARDRRAVSLSGDDLKAIARVSVQTEADQLAIWAATQDALRQPGVATLTTPFLQSVNQMFELAATRYALLEARLPAKILLMLVVYAAVTAGMVGYGLGSSHQRRLVGSTLLFLMVAATEALILDLDRPGSGGVRVSEAPMDRANAAITQREIVRLQARQANPDQEGGS